MSKDVRGRNIQIPSNLHIKVFVGLFVSIVIFLSIYAILYNFWGLWALVLIGFVPLVISLFIDKPSGEGVQVSAKDHPELFKLLEDISKKVCVKMPDEVLLMPHSEIAVTGMFRRKIIIGIASLRNLTEDEFRAIVTHEFGHFYGRDTIVGGIIWRIGRSLNISAHLGRKWWDVIPVMQIALIGILVAIFYKIYSLLFGFVALAYSRQVERRADIVAVQVNGGNSFYHGLLNYAAFTAYFSQISYGFVINKIAKEGKPPENIYKIIHEAYEKEDLENIRKQIANNEKRGMLDSHPSLKSRLKRISEAGDRRHGKPAVSLFHNFTQLEKEMSKALAQHSVALAIKAMHEDAKARHGKCKYCGKQFTQLKEFVEHESSHATGTQ